MKKLMKRLINLLNYFSEIKNKFYFLEYLFFKIEFFKDVYFILNILKLIILVYLVNF